MPGLVRGSQTSCRQDDRNAAAVHGYGRTEPNAKVRRSIRAAEIRANCLTSVGARCGNGVDRPRPKRPSRPPIVNSGLATSATGDWRRAKHDAFTSSCRRLWCPGVEAVQLCCLLRHANSPPFITAQCFGDFAMIGEAARAVTEAASSVLDTSRKRCGAPSARWLARVRDCPPMIGGVGRSRQGSHALRLHVKVAPRSVHMPRCPAGNRLAVGCGLHARIRG